MFYYLHFDLSPSRSHPTYNLTLMLLPFSALYSFKVAQLRIEPVKVI